MAFLGVSDDFDLDDHGILRDSASSTGGFLIDDDGIVRDDLGIYKHTGSHWSDSGFDGGKLSNTSTLRQLQTSFDDDSRLLDQSVNISEFEASKDDLSFEQPSVSGSYDFLNRGDTPQNLLDTGSSFDRSTDFGHNQDFPIREGTPKQLLDNVNLVERSGDFNETDTQEKKPGRASHRKDLFSEEYYNQLRDLGVLIDDGDLSDAKNSEFEQEEAYSSHEDLNYEEQDPLDNIGDFLQKDKENPDTISEFFRYETARTQNVLPGDFFQQTRYPGRPASPGSQTTVSNKSFPEVSPEEALLLYQRNRNAQFIDHAAEVAFGEQQQEIDPEGVFHRSSDNPAILERTGDDDEIFLITGGIIPSRNTNSVHSGTPFSNQSSRRSSLGSAQFETYNRDCQVDKRAVGKNSASVSKEVRPDSASQSRPPSSASYLSTTSDNQSRPNTARSDSAKKISKAKSQESFFEHNRTPRSEKGPKRLLPTPATDENQSYKLKSKSTTNISGQSGPVKPTHMSISQITRMTMEESGDGTGDGDKPPGEMTVRLKQEFQKRKQATELVQQLQKDYDSLLSKYALAELTIDQMRLGAKITLHADSPTPGQAQLRTMSPAQHQQVIQISGANRAVFSSSPSQGKTMSTYSSPLPEGVDLHDNHIPSGTPLLNDSWSTNRTDRGSHLESRPPSILEAEEKVIIPKNVGAESVKTSLLHHAGNINERIESFGNILETRQLTLEDQEKVFEQLRTDHEKLRRSYLQAKDDYNVLRRSGASITDANFDQNKQLEGELFRLGMRFDEIHEKVDKNMKEKSAKRQPFQANRLADDQQDSSHDEDESAIDQSKQMMHGTLAGSDLVQPMEDSEFEQKIQMLHDQYNALMDRYRRLKQMAQTPERDKEIDNLVKKLKEICNEAPDIFRLPPELEDRWDKMQKREAARGRSPLPDSQITDGANRENKQARSNKEEKLTDFEKLNSGHGENARRALNTSGSSRSGLVSPRDRMSHGDKINPLPSRYSPSPSNRFSPRDRSLGGRNSPRSDRDSPRSGRDSHQGNESPSDTDSYNSKVPRPRRRDHQFHDHEMKKRPSGGSMNSLPESSTSDRDSRTLANLPGPGKFKQMTKQRCADDTDSGFIGSVVGSDVSNLTSPLKQQQQQPQQQQQQQPQQQPVRLRHPEYAGNERTYSDQNLATGGAAKTLSTKTKVSPNEERPSSRSSVVRGREKRDAFTEADSMDVSFYDDVTESDLSELDVRSEGKKEEKTAGRQRESEDSSRTLEDSGQESDETPRPVQRLKLSNDKKVTAKTPLKPNHRSRVKSSDDEKVLTLRTSTLRDVPRERRRYSSEDADVDTSRSVDVVTPRSARPPQTRTITTKVADVQVPPRMNDEIRGRNEVKTEVRSQLRQENLRQLENRGVGSDLGWDAKGTDSDVTRASSVASSRLRALQIEVEKLKEKMQQVRETPAPPVAPPSQPQQPEYYDPFDDPYGFMRMPRRRANSFSGSPVREWDEWYWTLPLQRQNDGHDIPLGYAAADAYAEIPPLPAQAPVAQTTIQPPGRSRVRRRRVTRETPQGPVTTTVEQNGFTSDQPQTRTNPRVASGATPATAAAAAAAGPAAEQENVGLYEYYVPRSRYSTRGMRQQLTNQGYFQTPSGAKIFAAQQPGVAGSVPQPSVYRAPPAQTPGNAYQPAAVGAVGSQSQPFYNIRRPERRMFSQSQNRPVRMCPPSYVYDDVEVVSHSPDFHPGAVHPYQQVGQPTVEQYAVDNGMCPHCGVTSYHVHDEYDAATAVSDHAQYVYRRGRPRRRSRSLSRSRYYSPDDSLNRYVVKEITLDSSADSEVEIQRTRRRSRSLSRSRKRGRRYRKVHRDGYHSEREVRRDDLEESDLNASLNYSMDISRLTKKMIKTVKNELHKSDVKREFGSSYW